MSPRVYRPSEVAEVLRRRVVGQAEATEELAIALAKKLSGLEAGNVLLIGSSGTGKTTLMRAVEDFLAADRELSLRFTLVRVHANVLAQQAVEGAAAEALLHRLLRRAREQLGAEAGAERLLERVGRAIVFVDEVDKIRARVGDRPNVAGIQAQEALLTLIENEAVPLTLPEWLGGGLVTLDASSLLFVCAGAFEGLYDAVYDRVTVGRDRGALKSVSIVEESSVRQETRFVFRDWVRSEDLFEYGMTPQFLSRFDAVVVLNELGEDELVTIFLESGDSGYQQAQAYFEAHGVRLAMSPSAVRRVAAEAARQRRIGARALKEVFRRVVRSYEFDPAAAAPDGTLALDLPEIEAALAGC